MSTVALNNLLTYILSLGLSSKNKRWLADKLIEADKDTIRLQQEKMVKDSLTRAIQEMKESQRNESHQQTLDEFLNSL